MLFVGDGLRLRPRIWRIPAFHSADPRPVEQIGEDSTSIAICPRGKRLVYSKEAKDTDIWRIRLDPAAASPLRASPSQFIASTRMDSDPQYSPDGKYVAYQSERSGDSEIWIADSEGSASRQLTRLRAKGSGYPRWSPDGKHIVFHSRPSGYANIFTIDVQSGAYQQVTTGPTNDTMPSWSHDGNWIYFCSQREDGPQVWRMPAEGGPPSRLTQNGGAAALDSVDGKLVIYSKPTEWGLWALSLEGRVESKILPRLYHEDTFAVTKRGIYFVSHAPGIGALFGLTNLFSRVTKDLALIESSVGMGLTISPDESSMLFTVRAQNASDLILVENWK